MKKLITFIAVIAITILGSSLLPTQKEQYIKNVLSQDAYSYLSPQAKEYVKKIYEKTGEVVLTEKNRKEDKPYLNPQYVNYLELSDKEKEKVELIPDTYVIEYQTNQTYADNNLPKSYDLRNVDGHNYVSTMKNQGGTSICWAFATVENVETLLMKQKGQSYSDAMQQFSIRQMDYVTSKDLVKNASWISCSGSCSWTPWNNPDNGCRSLASSGNFYVSSIAMANAITLTDESVLPWTEANDPKWPKDVMGFDKTLYEADSTIQMPIISDYNPTEDQVNSYVNSVKTYITQYGGPSVGTYSPQSTCAFQNEDNKIVLKTDDCITKNTTKGHAMQIIGWDDNYTYKYCDDGTSHYKANNGTCSKGTYTEGKGAWLVRNSWGDDPDYKYVYLTYDSSNVSIGFTTSLKEMANRTWDNNYHGNPWIDQEVSKGMTAITSQTKAFDTNNTKSEKLDKIKFHTASKNGRYNISIITKNATYNNVASINTNEVGIYTVDLKSKNIVLNDSNFSVKIEGGTDFFFENSMSVFTSNVDKTPQVTSKSTKAYDPEKPLSNENPLYIDLYHNTYNNTYSWQTTTIQSTLKNLPEYAELSYRLKKNDIVANYFSDRNIHYEGNIATATFSGSSNSSYSNFSLKEEFGETWTMEIVYNDEVINSFPVKFNTDTKKTKSNVKLHANNGTNNIYEYSANDRTTSTFATLDGKQEFFNNGKYITSWNTKQDGTGTSYNADDGVLIYHDTELYAQWSNNLMNIRVEYENSDSYCNECTGSMSTQIYNYNDYIAFPINKFVRENYKFYKWKISKEGSGYYNMYYEQETSPMRVSEYTKYPVFNNYTITAYAQWISNSVTVNFNANGGSGTMKEININPEANTTLKPNIYTRNGYRFNGWNTSEDGTGTSYNDKGTINISEDITLYAQWTEVTNPITSVTLNKTSLRLRVEDSEKLTATIKPNDTTEDKTVNWTSSNPTVATVNSSGTVIAKAPGTTTITATAGIKSATCEVTVVSKETSMATITLNKSFLILAPGKSETLYATIKNASSTENNTVTWTSSNPTYISVDQNGKVTAKAGSGGATATITATLPNGNSATCEVSANVAGFKDVPPNSWFYDAVSEAYARNIISGYDAYTFAPHAKVTRGQLVTILWRLENMPDTSSINNTFTDVDNEKYYADGVKWAKSNGIVSGYGNTNKFGPNDPIIRQDLAVILNNYAKYKELDYTSTTDISEFVDYYSKVKGKYAENALRWAVKNKVMSGQNLGNGKRAIDPFNNTTRAEAAAMITNFIRTFNL